MMDKLMATFRDGAKCLCMMAACKINGPFMKTFFFYLRSQISLMLHFQPVNALLPKR